MEDSEWRASKQADKIKDREREKKENPLDSLRERIDHVDALLMRLLSERMHLSLMVADIKSSASIPVHDKTREKQVLAGIEAVSSDASIVSAITAVYETILSKSRELQAKSVLATGPVYFKEVMIVGLGLIGGALARRIRLVLPESKIVGCDRHEVLQAAIQQQLIDESCGADAIPEGVTLVLLCAPPCANIELLRRLAPHLRTGQVVLDVSSTKKSICREAETLDLRGADFIGGHPFFGTEKSGLSNSHEVVVEGKSFCLVPTAKSSELNMLKVSRWLNALGMSINILDAETHDQVAARVSHVNQLIATALGASLVDGLPGDKVQTLINTAGPSFHAMVRLMASPHALWQEIVADNSGEILQSLDALMEKLTSLRSAIERGDSEILKEQFETARKLTER